MEENKYYYIKLYNYILKDSRLNSNDKLVYSYVNNLNETNTLCFISNNVLSEHLGISKRTIQSSINKLIELDLIKKRYYKKGLKTIRILETTTIKINDIEKENKIELYDYDWLNDDE